MQYFEWSSRVRDILPGCYKKDISIGIGSDMRTI